MSGFYSRIIEEEPPVAASSAASSGVTDRCSLRSAEGSAELKQTGERAAGGQRMAWGWNAPLPAAKTLHLWLRPHLYPSESAWAVVLGGPRDC